MRSRVWTPWTHTNGGWEGETRKGDPQSKLGSRAVSPGFGWKTDSVSVLEEQRKRTLVINVGPPHTHTHVHVYTLMCPQKTWTRSAQTHGNGKSKPNSPCEPAWKWEEVSRDPCFMCGFHLLRRQCHTGSMAKMANPAEQGLVSLVQQLGKVGSPLLPK